MRTGVVALLLVARAARADDVAAAQALYDQAKQLEDQQKYAEACPLFAASFKADAQLGVLLNLADCNEKIGKTATAWSQFRDATDRAQRAGDPRAAYAQKRADALAPRLVRLRIVAPAPAPPGLVVTRDDTDVTALVGTDVPVDPGAHAIAATAPGYAPWQRSADVTGDGTTMTVQIELAKSGSATTTTAAPAKPPPGFTVRVLAGTSASEYGGDSGTFQHDGSGRPGIWIGARSRIRFGASRFSFDPELAFHNRAFGVAVCPSGPSSCSHGYAVVMTDLEAHALFRVGLVQRHTEVSLLAVPFATFHLHTANDNAMPMPNPAQGATTLDVGIAFAFELFVGRFGGQILAEYGALPISMGLSQSVFSLVAALGVRI